MWKVMNDNDSFEYFIRVSSSDFKMLLNIIEEYNVVISQTMSPNF